MGVDKKHFYSFPRSYSLVVISSANARKPGIGTEQNPSEGTREFECSNTKSMENVE